MIKRVLIAAVLFLIPVIAYAQQAPALPPAAYGTCMGYQPGVGGDFCLNDGAASFWTQFTGDVANTRGVPQCSAHNTSQCGKLKVLGINGVTFSGPLTLTGQTYCYNSVTAKMDPCTPGFPITLSNTPSGAGEIVVTTSSTAGHWVANTTLPTPTDAQIPVGQPGGTFNAVSMIGDCTITDTGAITCSKLNGVTPGGSCSGTTPFMGSLTSQAVPGCAPITVVPEFAGLTLTGPLVINGATSGTETISVAAIAGTGTKLILPPDNGANTYVLTMTDATTGATDWEPVAGSGTVTSITAGSGLQASPNPITGVGTISMQTPVSPTIGGIGIASPTAHSLVMAEGASAFNLITATTSGKIIIDQGAGLDFAEEPMSGDCTLTNLGAVTCTKTNGSPFAASATTDTTVATNINSGTLPAGRLPAFTGDTTTSAGSSVTTTGKINGTSVPSGSTADQSIVTTAVNTGAWKTIPDCTDVGGNHLNYTQATHSYSCGTSSSGGGGGGPDTTPTVITGTTAGTATCYTPFNAVSDTEIMCKLVGYENTTSTAQTYTYRGGVTLAVWSFGADNSNPPASATATVLSLPKNMATPFTGLLRLKGVQ